MREKGFDTPRDNILFEYGLFLGRVGLDRAFFIAEKDAKIPTDMLGITQTRYEVTIRRDAKKVATNSLEEGLILLKKQTDENLKLGHLGSYLQL
ncbi:TIR domain-containing protein [Prevotella intermedia]|uniref:TIR domain-containing protein n=1 Tax=Prevotella intermedia TaxID=28131 RepID=UPI001E461DB3|nr:TIR domain-containing protein [Prevotella intermedia]